MLAGGRVISITMMLFAATPASAQVINGESTYSDSDLHQPPAEKVPAGGEAKDAEPTRRPRDAPARR